MPNIKSAAKKHLQSEKRRLRNRTKLVSTRNMMKRLLHAKTKKDAMGILPTVVSMIDRLAKHHIIHKNNAANKKSRVTRYVNKLE